MAQRAFSLLSLTILATILFMGASAQSNSCNSAIVSLAPCLDYITGNSTTPSSSCCTQLSSVVRSEPQCLCMIINGGASSMGININQTQALALPGACNVQTPPVSQCGNNGLSPADPPSGEYIVQVPIFLLFSLLFAMVYLSTSPAGY
ncbi:uncharacterized protein A4U43_C07F32670 [Asparagus officinalis]|uniref:Bifunctional inhibitor/plant lipid transfer protein/seed storage helical domain-containing protein n=1 Tax=Asparagus officinalis TaxID=4686 RepID=A0A5P1EGX5_ASPOF|nr:non-specific lipid-transfer protein-like protein At2g13820 [Asparagus officinalis]ONK65023.1 uncharacterized protein A4U43_C07F32670 [Asparagus officinalis]